MGDGRSMMFVSERLKPVQSFARIADRIGSPRTELGLLDRSCTVHTGSGRELSHELPG